MSGVPRAAGESLRVAFVSHLSGHYGAERVLLEIVAGLSARKVACLALIPRGGTLAPHLAALNVPYERAPIRWWAGAGARWKRPLRLVDNLAAALVTARRLARMKVDLVYSNSSVSPTGALAAWLLRKPHVWHVHEFAEEDHGLAFDLGAPLAYALIGGLSRRVIVNSEAVQRKCARYMPGEKLRTVYAAVRSAAPAAVRPGGAPARREGPVTALVVGKIKESKGQMDAVRAVAQLAREGFDLRLVLAGTPEEPYAESLRRLVAAEALEGRVTLAGHVPEIAGPLEAADVVLVCSRSEAFGMATVEAMRYGKPVVGARSGATVELIRDGFNGLLYAPGDARDLAGQLRRLLEDRELAVRMGEHGRRWAAERFSLDRLTDEVQGVLEEALRAPGRGRA